MDLSAVLKSGSDSATHATKLSDLYCCRALAVFDLGGNIVQSLVPNLTEVVEFPASRKVEQQSFPVMQMLAQPCVVFQLEVGRAAPNQWVITWL